MASCQHHLLLFLLLVTTVRYSTAQPPSNDENGDKKNPYSFQNANFNPSMAILIIVLVSAFFFLGFFSLYLRQCTSNRRVTYAHDASIIADASHPRRHCGLDREILSTFPTLVYSEVESYKLGSDSLECAVCLSEFKPDDALRLLPRCSHVFHPDCIDTWLASHVTCPICRSNLAEIGNSWGEAVPGLPGAAAAGEEELIQESNPGEHVAIEVAEGMEDLEKFVNMKRARSRVRMVNFPWSHSTGHSVVLPGENLSRFTLRLPEDVRREMMKRTRSCVVFRGEGSARRGYRGRPEPWGSFLMRTMSMKRGFFRRNESMKGEAGGSVTPKVGFFHRGDSVKGEGSSTPRGGGGGGVGRFNGAIAPFDCYGGESQPSRVGKV